MAARQEVLSNAGILLLIFSYDGPGSWLFISPVCKLWKQLYEQLDPVRLQKIYPHATIQLTAYGNALQSPSRLQMSCDHGLHAFFTSELLQSSAGAFSDVPTLLAAQELGFQVTDDFFKSSAATGQLAVLNLVHIDQGVPLPANISDIAAAFARMEVLRWLQEVSYAFNESTAAGAAAGGHKAVLLWLVDQEVPIDKKLLRGTAIRYGHMSILSLLHERDLLPPRHHYSSMLQLAGAFGHLDVAQWLRQRGAEWPAILKYGDKPWTGAVLEWARAEGCTSPTEE
jgi:hypothetical protein